MATGGLRFAGKTAVVTGASSGLGRAIAQRLAAEGAKVVLVARRVELLEALAGEILQAGGEALVVVCDLSQADECAALVRKVKDTVGKVDLLVNNAGKEQLAPLQATSGQAIQDMVQLNLISVLLLTKGLLGTLREGSSIVNMASTAAIDGAPGSTVYSATKGALISFTQSLARELAPRKIRVNAIAPGQVRTDMLARVLGRVSEDQAHLLEAMHPLGFGEPEDIAAAVAFLGSRDAKWITGHVLVVDGGLTG